MKKKRLLSLTLAAAMIFGSAAMLPEGTFVDKTSISASAYSEGKYEYQILSDGTAELSKYNGTQSTVTIPATLGGRTVTSIGESAFSDNSSITSVIIPDCVLHIETAAFYMCANLSTVNLGSGLKEIDTIAFALCSSLSEIIIPDGVTEIGDAAFFSTGLLSVIIPDSVNKIGSAAFLNTEWLELQKDINPIVIVNDILIDASVYRDTTLSIPYGVKSISYIWNSRIKEVIIPETVTEICNSGFENCPNLKKVELLDSIECIGDYAFYRCPSLKNITIPKSVTNIGKYAFGYDSDEDNNPTKIDNFKLYCYMSSAGQTYAIDYELDFTVLDLSYDFNRLAGKGRYETAVAISKASYNKANTVILANSMNYADALAGVTLANSVMAPILLTNTDKLEESTLNEIKRLGAKHIIILGGEGAISTTVETTLKKEGLATARIAGASRFGTATAIAEKLSNAPTDVFFVYAFNYADALSVSAVAAVKRTPIIYLKTNGELDDATAAYLAKLKAKGCVRNAYVIGGEGVISDDMANKAAKALGLSKTTRIAGKDRFATCVEVNKAFANVLTGSMICIATGMDFPDALAGGVYAARNKAPLFLINGKLKTPKLTDEQKAYLKTKAAGKITAFGGVGVVPDNHIADIAKTSI